LTFFIPLFCAPLFSRVCSPPRLPPLETPGFIGLFLPFFSPVFFLIFCPPALLFSLSFFVFDVLPLPPSTYIAENSFCTRRHPWEFSCTCPTLLSSTFWGGLAAFPFRTILPPLHLGFHVSPLFSSLFLPFFFFYGRQVRPDLPHLLTFRFFQVVAVFPRICTLGFFSFFLMIFSAFPP